MYTLYKPTELLKAKYTRRWKGKDGKWRYEYARGKKGRQQKTNFDTMDAMEAVEYMEANEGKKFSVGGKTFVVGEEIPRKMVSDDPTIQIDVTVQPIGPESSRGVLAWVDAGTVHNSGLWSMGPKYVRSKKPLRM
jgi:hypothetical protein